MTLRPKPFQGQSLVETVLALPLLLVLLAGGFWLYRDLSLASSAESAAQAQMLRTGRRQPGIGSPLSETILSGDNAVRIQARTDPLIGQVPPFRGLSGRTVATTDVAFAGEAIGAFLDLPSHGIRSEAKGAVDCWDKETPSGTAVRRVVRGIASTGAIR